MSDTNERPEEHRDRDAEQAGSTPRSPFDKLRTLPADISRAFRAPTSPQSTDSQPTGPQSTGFRRFTRRFGVAGALVVVALAVAVGAALPDSGWIGGTGGGDDTAAGADRRTDDRAGRSGADRAGGNDTTQGKAAPAKPREWVYPMANYRVTSCFGQRWGRQHRGIDLAWHNGEPILAAHKGTVTRAGDAGDGYGRKVVISHGNNTYTLYGHGSKVLVRVGQQVVAGQRIALEGTTGHSTGPHLHFEVHHGYGNRINPAPYMRDRGVDFGTKC